jgi:hypothetical protein
MLGSYSTFDIKPLNSREILKLPADSMISVHSDISKLESRGIEVLKTESGEPYYLIDGILLQPGHAYALTKR